MNRSHLWIDLKHIIPSIVVIAYTFPMAYTMPMVQENQPQQQAPEQTLTAPIMPTAQSTPPEATIPMATDNATAMPTAQNDAPASAPMPTISAPDLAAPQAKQTYPEEKIGTQGNWMKKKDWLLRSNQEFEAIQNTTLAIQKIRNTFSDRYHTIDKELDNFYHEASVDQGKIQELFSGLERYLEKKKKTRQTEIGRKTDDGLQELSEHEYALRLELLNDEIKKNKEDLEQLKLDLQSISDLDLSIIQRIERVDQQTGQARTLYEKAETLLDALWEVIDDSIARTTYYTLKNDILVQLQTIKEYLEIDLLQNLDSVIETTRMQMQKTLSEIKNLEENGFVIKNRSERIQEIKLQQEKERLEQQEKEIATKVEVIDLKKIKKRPTRWYEKIYDNILTTISKIHAFFSSVTTYAKKDVQKTQPEKQSTESSPVATTPPQPQEPTASMPTMPALQELQTPTESLSTTPEMSQAMPVESMPQATAQADLMPMS